MDDPALQGWEQLTPARIVRFSVREEPDGDAAFLAGDKLVVRIGSVEESVALRQALRLPGQHNVANALAAAAAALAFGVQPWQIAEALCTFSGLPHRLEMVARGPREVTYYNDSIATTPESVICALSSFDGPITLIAGGSDKGCPYDELGKMIVRKVRRLVLLGLTAPRILEAVTRAAQALRRSPAIIHARDLDEAVRAASSGTLPGEAVLLSPASASFDMFRNFEERGDKVRVLARRVVSNAG
jgi:UDP-N-acetylmuramoylalanine--D-glutamate ligase